MKVVINKCFGGFGLSPKAVRRLAELQGRPCYFFNMGRDENGHLNLHEHVPVDDDKAGLFSSAFDIPNPDEVIPSNAKWSELTMEERARNGELYRQHSLSSRPDDRADPLLIQVVEELGAAANGRCADLQIVEIPDGTDWAIDEYDGMEHVEERHQTWG